MPKNKHTQALLDEVKSPTHADRATGEKAVLAFLPTLTKLAQQAAEEMALTQTADMAEADEDLRARFELYRQTAGAQLRICGEIERHTRDLVTTLRQRERYDAEIREAARQQGYKP
ncbi:MAG: hypothetical protein M3Q39_00980 [Actinomycetota bacterium]|nr:hypothetical protein [Actinomycetota bacterium]